MNMTHLHATAGREPGLNSIEQRPNLWVKGLSQNVREVPMIYQNQPTDMQGRPILPHRWWKSSGEEQVQVANRWDAPEIDRYKIADAFAEWAANRWANHTGYICLNIESIEMDSPAALLFWDTQITALREACPSAFWGFYDRPILANVDFYAPCIYPTKFVRPDADLIMANEHEMGISEYRRRVAARVRCFPIGKRMLMFTSTKVMGGRHAGGWCSRFEMMAQMEAAQTHSAESVIWWASFEDAIDYRRHIGLVNWARLQKAPISL